MYTDTSILSEPVKTIPDRFFGNGRSVKRYQLWVIRFLFIFLVVGELYEGSYIRDWGLFSERMVSTGFLIFLVYGVIVWIWSALTYITYKNIEVSGEDLRLLNNERTITNYRLWSARVVAFIFFISPYTSEAGETSTSAGQYSIIGVVIGASLVYWLILYLLSSDDGPQ